MKVSNIRQSQEPISNIHNIRHILERSEESKMNLMVHLKKTHTQFQKHLLKRILKNKTQTILKAFIKMDFYQCPKHS
jgi:hypothetical protein